MAGIHGTEEGNNWDLRESPIRICEMLTLNDKAEQIDINILKESIELMSNKYGRIISLRRIDTIILTEPVRAMCAIQID